ncbi:hypothetical protein Q5H93_14900 [Hymenobacter sp. ASUV-10]|uniref:Cadherin domain-containing protein n=1 Tax=Hymenobacter aranciens TaxID=3063996 RepID=A0ABT9BCN3_9BACT|nr:hypothetical protein [Hymenobacter sp. ASUV-10]MDO7876030.1 hypothetical protein [Hymenobacter sp. ASUV-10]
MKALLLTFFLTWTAIIRTHAQEDLTKQSPPQTARNLALPKPILPVPLRINSIPSDFSLETTNTQSFSFTALNPDSHPLQWSLKGSTNPFLKIDPSTGILSWTPPSGPDADIAVKKAIKAGALVLNQTKELEVKVINSANPTEQDVQKFNVTIFDTNIESPKFRRPNKIFSIQEGQEFLFKIPLDFTDGQKINIVTAHPQGKGAVTTPTGANPNFTWIPSFDVVPADDPDRKITERLFFEAKNSFNRSDTMTIFVVVEDRPDCKTDAVRHANEIGTTTEYLSKLQSTFASEHAQAEKRRRLRTTFDVGAAILGGVGGVFGLLPAQTSTQTTTAAILAFAGASALTIKLLAVPEDTKAATREQELVAAINQIGRRLLQVRNFDCTAPTQKENLQALIKTRDDLLDSKGLALTDLLPADEVAKFQKAKAEYEKRNPTSPITAP